MFSVLGQFLWYLVILGGAAAVLLALFIDHWWGWFMLAVLCTPIAAGLVQGWLSTRR